MAGKSSTQMLALQKLQWEYMVQEMHSLEEQIHQYLRLTPHTMNLALIGTGAVITYLASGKYDTITGYVLLIITPLVLGALATYHNNVAAQVAAMAEQRDRLATILNQDLKRNVFLGRIVSNNRRGALGTLLFSCISVVLVVTTLLMGWYTFFPIVPTDNNQFQGKTYWFWGWVGSASLTIISIVFSYIDILRARRNVNDTLDLYFGVATRPDKAPSPKDNWFKQMWDAITINRSQGHSKIK